MEDLIELQFHKNDEGEMVDPVTFKVFTDNTHIVTLKNTGNVFAYDTVERLNVKAKMWRDLVSDDEFGRKDIVTLQDPQNIQSRNLSSFKYLQEGISTLTEEQKRERSATVNQSALGNAASVLETTDSPPPSKPQVGKYLHQRLSPSSTNTALNKKSPYTDINSTKAPKPASTRANTSKANPYNAAQHTTGQAAASFTSTGLTPHTSAALALLSDEEYMLRPRRVKTPGYARITTTHGALDLELLPEFAPKAVWNFIQLARKGYYDGVGFHRNIRNFMLQGGDPTGTGKGGNSIWGRNFADEFDGPLNFDARGMLAMANKGKNTNSSQFFITYRPCRHLDRKHTVFGRLVDSDKTLAKIENVQVEEESKRPLEEVRMEKVSVFVDPFEVFLKERGEREERERQESEVRRNGGREEERVTWTGKRVRGVEDGGRGEGVGVGKYLTHGHGEGGGGVQGEAFAEWEAEASPVAKKKFKGGGGFGNFEGW